MAGYTKLFSSIVNSTIWREENHVRLVWITMLALADKNGLVEASIPGLADAARVTIQECENALERLMSPDEYSRSQENEGKRIAKEDGGWLLLNYVRYRGKLTQEKIREQNRIRQQRFRDKKRNVTVTHNGDITPINAQSESESESKANKKKPPIPPKGFDEFWQVYPKKTGKQAALRAWRKAVKMSDPDTIIEAVKNQTNWPQWKKDGGQYIPNPATWLNQGRWEDEIDLSRPWNGSGEKLTASEQQQRRNAEVIEAFRRGE